MMVNLVKPNKNKIKYQYNFNKYSLSPGAGPLNCVCSGNIAILPTSCGGFKNREW